MPRPSHRSPALNLCFGFVGTVRVRSFAPPTRRDFHAVRAIGREYTVIGGEVHSGFGDQGHQFNRSNVLLHI
jgi:hypothetical protein